MSVNTHTCEIKINVFLKDMVALDSERTVVKRVCRRGRVKARISIRREMLQLHDLVMKSLSKGLILKTAFEDQ